jgi:hypothetical protein
MTRHRATSAALFFAAFSPGFCAVSLPAIAGNDVPESLRIEQKALKAYSAQPVVPIDRGNAHHRDAGGIGGDDISPEKLPQATAPSDMTPPPSGTQPAQSGEMSP